MGLFNKKPKSKLEEPQEINSLSETNSESSSLESSSFESSSFESNSKFDEDDADDIDTATESYDGDPVDDNLDPDGFEYEEYEDKKSKGIFSIFRGNTADKAEKKIDLTSIINPFATADKKKETRIYMLCDELKYGIASYFGQSGLPIYCMESNPELMSEIITDLLFTYDDDTMPRIELIIADTGTGRFISKKNLEAIEALLETTYKDFKGSHCIVATGSQQITTMLKKLRTKVLSERVHGKKYYDSKVQILPSGTLSLIPQHVNRKNLDFQTNPEFEKEKIDVNYIATHSYDKIEIPSKLRSKLKNKVNIQLDIPIYNGVDDSGNLREFGKSLKQS